MILTTTYMYETIFYVYVLELKKNNCLLFTYSTELISVCCVFRISLLFSVYKSYEIIAFKVFCFKLGWSEYFEISYDIIYRVLVNRFCF